MINTVNTKSEQLSKGFFSVGSGKETILILGSCRSIPYMNYFNIYNNANNNQYTINFIDPFYNNWNEKDQRVDYEEALLGCEQNDVLIEMFGRVDIFIHEYYSNAGLFNCDKTAQKNIYQFGLSPKIDICIPNYNDVFVLFGDIVTFDVEMRKRALQDYNTIGKISEETQSEIFNVSQKNLNKFYDICLKSDFPEMKTFFSENITSKRMFWTYNHITKEFSCFIFFGILKKFMGIELSESLSHYICQQPDMFANNYTYLTEFDVKWHGYNWGEEIKSLRDKL